MIETTLENLQNDYNLLTRRTGSLFEIDTSNEISSFEDAWNYCIGIFHQDAFSEIYKEYQIDDIDSYLDALKPAIAVGTYYIGHDYLYRKSHENAHFIYNELSHKKAEGNKLSHNEGHIKKLAKQAIDSEKVNPGYFKNIHSPLTVIHHTEDLTATEKVEIRDADLIHNNWEKYSTLLKRVASADSFLVNPYLSRTHPDMYSGVLIAFLGKIHRIDVDQLICFTDEELALLDGVNNDPNKKKSIELSREARVKGLIDSIKWREVVNLLPVTTLIIQSACDCLDGHSQLDKGKISAKRLLDLSDTVTSYLKYDHVEHYQLDYSDDDTVVELSPTCSVILNTWAADELFRLPRISSALAFFLTYINDIQKSPNPKQTQMIIQSFCTSILQLPTKSLRKKCVNDYRTIANAFSEAQNLSEISHGNASACICRILLINSFITPILRILLPTILFCRANSIASDKIIKDNNSKLGNYIEKTITSDEFSTGSNHMWEKDFHPLGATESYIWDDKDYFTIGIKRIRGRDAKTGKAKNEYCLTIKEDLSTLPFENIFQSITNQHHKWSCSDFIWKLKLTRHKASDTSCSLSHLFKILLLEATYYCLPDSRRKQILNTSISQSS